MVKQKWLEYIEILKREVVPALGCTEPVAIALATARATEALGEEVEEVVVQVSGNLLKNGMGVGVPGTGMTGLGIAAAVGVTGGKSELALEVLRDLDGVQLAAGKKLLAEGRLHVELADTEELLYVDAVVKGGGHSARCVIARAHAATVLVEKDGVEVFSIPWPGNDDKQSGCSMSMQEIFEFATEAPLKELEFILETVRLNEAIAAEGLSGDWGLRVGKSIDSDIKDGIRADDIVSAAVKTTAAASDARMDGIQLPVMSNSGSGNQGITATLPVVTFARRRNASEEQLVRALILSHLSAVHMKSHLGKLSALCGATLAATASGCGIVLLLGGGLKEVESAMKNTFGDVAGLICDGAKTSCALKVATAVEAAVGSALLAMRGISVPGKDGILDEDIETCIRNVGQLGSKGMAQTDKVILGIMTGKHTSRTPVFSPVA